jgi:hypothetical protein
LAFALWLGVPALATARDDGAAVWGANHFCFQEAIEQPGDPYGGDKFGLLHLQPYLEDCRGEMFLPTDESP